MTKLEYLEYSLKNKLYRKAKWIYSIFGLPVKEDQEDEYKKVKGRLYYVKVDGDYRLIDDCTTSTPILQIYDTFKIKSESLPYWDKDVTTTVGILMANIILVLEPFKGAIDFINGPFDIKTIEKKIVKLLKKDIIKVQDYINFVDATSYFTTFTRIATISATYKNSLPPKGLKEFKEKLRKKMEEKYGPEWNKNRTLIVEYETELKKFDDEWLKDDPSNGVFVAGKVKSQGRMKMYLSFGAETGFGIGDPVHVDRSLLEDLPEDKEQLTSMFNASRYGSYGRGKETQKGGATAKDVLRATSATKIIDGDCGVKYGKIVHVTEEHHAKLEGRYQIINGKSVLIEDTKSLIGKTIEIRSPMYCKTKGNKLCAKCVGDMMAKYKDGISLLVTDISSIILNTSMKAMHGIALKTIELNFEDVMS